MASFDHLQLWQATPANLLTIPQDLLIEIMSRLEWKDILRLRQTCHALQDASKLRIVWLSLYARAMTSKAVQPRLQVPIELCSDDDLERRTLRLLTSELSWEQGSSFAGVQSFLPRKTRDVFHLVEGGRWLLIATETGSLHYYDLDESHPKARALIPDQFEDCYPSITADVDEEGPFRLALHILWHPAGAELGQSVIQIWQLSLEIDSSDLSVGLSAIKLTSFLRAGQFMQTSLSLCGNLVSYSTDFLPGRQRRVLVIDWSSLKEGDMLTWAPLWQSPIEANDKIYSHSLAPGGLVVVVYSKQVQVFDVFDWSKTSSHPPTQATSHIWGYDIELSTISRPFLSRKTNTIRLIIGASTGIYGLILQRGVKSDQRSPPQLVELLHYTYPRSIIMFHGYHYSVGHHGSLEIDLIRYPWPDEQGWPHMAGLQKKPVGGDGYSRTLRPCIDEHSGRIAVTPALGYLSVLDFALSKPIDNK